uniref:Glycyl-tRNA synthetase beta subunit n=1 Tax=Cucumis sativus TaxID=3659 RepID=A0A0A0KV17_CUCSA
MAVLMLMVISARATSSEVGGVIELPSDEASEALHATAMQTAYLGASAEQL